MAEDFPIDFQEVATRKHPINARPVFLPRFFLGIRTQINVPCAYWFDMMPMSMI